MRPIIYVDFRCLQDPDFQYRGIGYHTSALLRARWKSPLADCKTVGLVDPQFPPVPPGYRELVDEIAFSVNPPFNGNRFLFMDGSPMTHDTRFTLRLQNHPGFFGVAALHDFIPWDWPGYLPSVGSRIDYVAKLARLRYFRLFFPISEYTASRLSELTSIPRSRMTVTGACVRRSLYELREAMGDLPSAHSDSEPYFVTLGGDDSRRKNTEIAIKAVQRLNLLYGRRIPIKVIGFYCDAYRSDLVRLAGKGASGNYLEFYPSIPDEEVVALHAGALASIAPSFIEGFSLPVAEASVCGCPVLASTCAAHMELIEQSEALFDPEDVLTLSEKLEAIMHHPELRASLAAAQSHLGPKFHEEKVGARFWERISDEFSQWPSGTLARRSARQRIAFLSPYPPDRSIAATYTAETIRGGRKLFDSDLYTNSNRPLLLQDGVDDAGPVTLAPMLDRRLYSVISVLGMFSDHAQIFDAFERFGGPCVLHDLRIIGSWARNGSSDKFCRLAGRILRRTVSPEEVNAWEQQPNPPPEFMAPILKRALPLIVHTKACQDLVRRLYGVDAQIITACPTVSLDSLEVTPSVRDRVRRFRGISPDTFVVSAFGEISGSRGLDSGILAVELLRSWNIPAVLYFIGDVRPPARDEFNRIATMYEIEQYIYYTDDSLTDETYRDFLIASDASIELRADAAVAFSPHIHNSLGAGLPCVATSEWARFSGADEYIATVPDRFSPLLVAEQLAPIWESRNAAGFCEEKHEKTSAYLEKHNFTYYAECLAEILGLA